MDIIVELQLDRESNHSDREFTLINILQGSFLAQCGAVSLRSAWKILDLGQGRSKSKITVYGMTIMQFKTINI